MTWLGGANQLGTIFKIMPDGTGYTVLMNFDGVTNGNGAIGSLISDGIYLYGMTAAGGTDNVGTIFKIMPNGSNYLNLYDFSLGISGNSPEGSLISDGTFLYGLTRLGGVNDRGTIFKIMPDGSNFLKLHDFGCGTDGRNPYNQTLILDGAMLYGTTNFGGTNDMGTIFKILTSGADYEKLFDFDSAINGSYPNNSLLSDGNFLYGMTSAGGTVNRGTIFKYGIPITPPPATYCAGETIQLNATGGVSYLWNGPNSYTSTVQNPTITSSNTNMSGTYTVTVTDADGCVTTASTVVNVNPLPTATISAPQFLCEMNPNSITINSATTFQSIVWSTNPGGTNYSFTGQGTTTITPSSVWPTDVDLTVSVVAIDGNGCQFSENIELISCCDPNTSGTEFFERTYTQMGLNNISNQLPNGYYNGPTQQVVINLPAPQPLANQITTPYSTSTTITQFILDNPGIYNPGSIITTPNWIFFNNDLIIDLDVAFEDCHFIRFAPGAKIIVEPGVSFYATRSTLAPKCREMWGGIELTDNTQTVNLDNVSIIGAVNGISTSNGGLYVVENSRFIDNLYGISVQNYTTAPTLSTVENTYFGDVIGQQLLSPYQTEPQPLAGILIKNIRDIVVGPTSSIRGNLFHNHQRGISSSASTVHSFKNNFYNIRHAASVPLLNEGDKFAAIYAVNAITIPGGLLNHSLEVGGNLSVRNNFVNCEFGVSSKNGMNLDARFNYMKNCALRGISAEDNRLKTINIYNNQINSTNSNAWGIYVKNYSNGIANIYLNEINTNSNTFSGITRFAAGIYVSSVTPTVFQTTNINYNTVQNCLYGIWMINTAGGSIEANNVTMNFTNNVINTLSTDFAPIRGIVIQNSPKAKIKSNEITRNMGPGNGVVNNNLQGIRLELSPAAEVWSNSMTNTAVGFYAYGTSLGARIDCNQMHFTRNGFFLDLADLSDQGAPVNDPNYPNGYGADNKWYNTFGDETDGNLPLPINNYYHTAGSVYNSDPSISIITFWLDNPIVSAGVENFCIQAINPPNGETPISKRTRELLPIVQNSIQYDSMDYQQKHFLHLAAYSRLENDINLLVLNVPDDSIYLNFMEENNNLNSQSKVIYDAQIAISQNDFSAALNACSQIFTACNQYNTNKVVQELWIDRKSNGLEFTSADTLLLMNIACLDPIEFGSGVYQARAMIDWDGFCFSQNKSSDYVAEEIDSVLLSSKVFPNPSEGNILIESALGIENVIILDLKGAELRNFTNIDNSEIETQLSTGVYLLKIIFENGIVETHKIYIK